MEQCEVGTLATDAWGVPNVTAYPSVASVPIVVLLYNGPLLQAFVRSVPIKGYKFLSRSCKLQAQLYDGLKLVFITGFSVYFNFYHTILCMHSPIRCRKMSVCPSITRRYCVETAEHMIKLFSPRGSHTILQFPDQTLWQYSEGTRNFRPMSGFGIDNCWSVDCCQHFDGGLRLQH